MSRQRPNSVGTIQTLFDVELKVAEPRAMPPIPADHRDPNHPHNGDVERQLGTPRKPLFRKKILWIVALTLLVLGTLGAALGIGLWYDRNHGKDNHAAPLVGNATTTIFTTVDQIGLATTTQTKTIEATTATTFVTLAPMPTNNGCKQGGIWPSEDQCRAACVGIQGYELVHCGKLDDGGHFWQCHQCAAVKPTVPFNTPVQADGTPTPDPKPTPPPSPPKDEPKEKPKEDPPKQDTDGNCLISGHFSSKDECKPHCNASFQGENVGCDIRDGAWKCYRCPGDVVGHPGR